MTYLVTDGCVRCRYTDCVEVCPVDAFHAGDLMLVINPEVCIDCGVCEPECPVNAIVPQSEDSDDGKWMEINAKFASLWPILVSREAPLPAHADFAGETGKFERFLGGSIQ